MAAKILVVEDEILIRWSLVADLEDAGFAVAEAGSVDEALQILEEDQHVDLLFTDVRLPGELSGLDLAQIAEDRWPAMPVLITSGHAVRGVDVPERARFFSKPYAVPSLVMEMKNLLDAA